MEHKLKIKEYNSIYLAKTGKKMTEFKPSLSDV